MVSRRPGCSGRAGNLCRGVSINGQKYHGLPIFKEYENFRPGMQDRYPGKEPNIDPSFSGCKSPGMILEAVPAKVKEAHPETECTEPVEVGSRIPIYC